MLANLEFNCVPQLSFLTGNYVVKMQIREDSYPPFFFLNAPNLTSCKNRRKKISFIRRAFSVSLGFLCLPETDSVFVHESPSPNQTGSSSPR